MDAGDIPGQGEASEGGALRGEEEVEEKEQGEEEVVRGLGRVSRGDSSVEVVFSLQFRVVRLLHKYYGKEVISHLRNRVTDNKSRDVT